MSLPVCVLEFKGKGVMMEIGDTVSISLAKSLVSPTTFGPVAKEGNKYRVISSMCSSPILDIWSESFLLEMGWLHTEDEMQRL